MRNTHQQRLIPLALLALPLAAAAADAREETVARNAGVAVEPAHRAHVISANNRTFGIDTSKIVWIVTEPARTRVLLPAEERALLAARESEFGDEDGDASGSASSDGGQRDASGAARRGSPDATVYFPFGSAHILDAAPIYTLLPRITGGVRLDGYTDQVGTEKYNLALSLRRATSASKLFLGSGVSANLIEIAGHGESNPADAVDDAKNRRVEITLTGGVAK